jgi:hypothetical protein
LVSTVQLLYCSPLRRPPAALRTTQVANLGVFKSIHKTPLSFAFSSVFPKRENIESIDAKRHQSEMSYKSERSGLPAPAIRWQGANQLPFLTKTSRFTGI